ncbi:hypothetical protein [Burkholderia glumae]|uniref:hypothetical protein n=1 Tax=Burkholderia glumae TaxID=337 RepID=UPI002036CD57|nr:hypothetical protein [Burkholderia glumae]MCM2548570.1 hypothetical protein [Burkholderia glumae]
MAKRELTPEYRAGAVAFAALVNGLPDRSDGLYFSRIAKRMHDARANQSADWLLGFDEALGVLIDESITGVVFGKEWSPMLDLEDPDWWREEEPEGENHD